jgi:HEAT repeat protein
MINNLVFAAMTAAAFLGEPRTSISEGPARGPAHLPALLAQGAAADSLWKAGRYAIADEEWDKAADIFARVRSRFPRSAYVGDSYYWQAYALYQKGSNSSLRQAVTLLDRQLDEYESARTTGDARALRARIRGNLAQGGDEQAAAAISKLATDAVTIGLGAAARALEGVAAGAGSVAGAGAGMGTGAGSGASRNSRASTQSGRCRNEEDDERVMALNALLNMNGDDALPLLKEVLKRREPCSEILRRKAVFLVSQKRGSEAADILMDLAKNDPDKEVREQAVFWLSSVAGDRSVTLLEQILKTSNDPEMQDKAVFSLHNSNQARAAEVLRDYAAREDAPDHVREQAIFWLGQRRSTENAAFLKQLFNKVRSDEMKDKIIFSISQQKSDGNAQWLIDQAMNTQLKMELRKQALFWAGQTGAADVTKLAEVYDKGGDAEFKEQVIFVLSQKGRNAAAIDKLIDIGKNEKNRDLREKAIFWLGQSRDPRALKALQDIILKSPDGE